MRGWQIITRVGALISVLLFDGSSFAKMGSSDPLAELLNRLSKSENLKKLQSLDGAIAITYKGKVIYKNIFGFKRNKLGSITASTLFPLASSSKPISAALIAYLAKQKKLSFDDSIHSVVTGIDSRVTLKHILSHSSGYNDLVGNKAVESGQSRDKIIRLFDGNELNHSPGTNYSYSNVIFSLLENLISQRTYSSYEENMTKFLAGIGIEGEEICNVTHVGLVAFPHRLARNKLTAMGLPIRYASSVCSAAGLYLSIDHMSNFVHFMLGHSPEVLDRRDLEVLFQPQVEVTDIFRKWNMKWPFPINELKSYYGLGWRILEWRKKNKSRLIFHSGHLNGITSFIGLLPEKDLGIVILSNQDVVFGEPLGIDFWKYSLEVFVED